MTLVLALRQLWRSRNNTEFRILSLAMILAIFSVTLLTCLTQGLGDLFSKDAASLLGADLVIESPHPLPEQIIKDIEKQDIQHSQNIEFFSMLMANDKLQLTNINAIASPFPLRGNLRIKNATQNITVVTSAPPQGEIWLEQNVIDKLAVKLNDVIKLGDMTLTLTGVIVERPLAMSSSNVLAPLAYVNRNDLPAMAVLQPGSRATYRLLMAGDAVKLKQVQTALNADLLKEANWVTPESGRRGLGQTLVTVKRYVAIILLVQIFLAGIAIALSSHQFSTEQRRNVALLRCLGVRSRTIFAIYFLELFTLALLATLCGVGLGYVVTKILFHYAQTVGLYAVALNWQGGLLGGFTGFLLMIGFVLPPLYELRKISPAQIFQAVFVSNMGIHLLSYTMAILTLLSLFFVFVSEPDVAFQLLIQSCILSAAIFIIAWGIWLLFEPLSRFGGLVWRFGLSYLVRHRAQTISQWLVFTLVIMLLMLVQIIKQDFMQQWRTQLPPKTPNYFLLNVQSDQVVPLQQWLQRHGIAEVTFYPIVRGRMSHINDQEVSGNRGLSRSINLTWMQQLPANNQVIAGSDWEPHLTGQAVVSVESGFAKRQNIHLNDTLSFQVGEDRVTAKIIQIRNLEWTSFTPNFFVIFPDKVIDQYPHSFITSIYVPKEQKTTLLALSKEYIEVSVIDIDDILQSVRNIINKLSTALEVLLSIVFALGILIMYASLLSSLRERLQESAMLQILGAKKAFIGKLLVIEFGLLGLFSGVVGSAMAMLLAEDLAQRYFAMSFSLDPKWFIYGTFLSTTVITLFGLIGARKVFQVSPLWLLRQNS